jgi:hypothetical protein
LNYGFELNALQGNGYQFLGFMLKMIASRVNSRRLQILHSKM